MKKIIFYLLFSILIYQTGGYIVSFNIMKYNITSKIKMKIKEKLNDNEFQVFNLNEILKDETFKWEEKDKEFWYKGKIFDIVKIGNTGVLKCIDDIQEKKLFQNLDGYVNGFFTKNPNGKKSMQTINSLFFALFLPSKEIKIPNTYCWFTSSISNKINIPNSDTILSIVLPPPRFL